MNLIFSHHAMLRAAQRNLSVTDMYFVRQYGTKNRNAGVIFCHLLGKNLPRSIAPNQREEKLIGTTLVLCKCGQYVITVYRDPHAFKKDLHKQKYDFIGDTTTCPFCNLSHAA